MSIITVDVDEAGRRLDELIDSAAKGAEVVITRDDRPVAMLVRSWTDRKAGSARGLFTIHEDFDEPLEDFKDYM